jgi:two-component system, NtrC family, sensor histidine kinase KinB
MLSRFSLRTKLLAAFLVVAALTGVIGYFNLQALRSSRALLDQVLDDEIPHLVVLREIGETAAATKTEALLFVHEEIGALHGKEAKEHLLTHLDELNKQNKEYTESVEDHDADRESIDAQVKGVTEQAHQLIASKEQGLGGEELEEKEEGFLQAQEALVETVHEIESEEVEGLEAQDKVSDKETTRLVRLSEGAIVFSTVFATSLGLLIAFSITRAVRRVRDGAQRIATGDFSQAVVVKSRDEIGQLAKVFNEMSDRLRDSYRRLAFEKKRDETLLESLGEGLVVIDEKTNITLINSQATYMLDFGDSSKALGIPLNHIMTLYNEQSQLLSASETPAVAALESGKSVSQVAGFKRKDGAKVLLGISATPFLLENRVAGAIMIFRDVTKEKEIDRMKTEFISLASHQLRTPLSAIKWFAEMLVNGDAGKLTDEQQDFAQNISDSTERMIDLVNSLLNISRIESGRIIIDPKPTDLQELVSGITNDLKAKTEDKQQSLIVSVHKELGKINIDPHLIGQVYMNFLTNAIKYTPKGGEVSVFISRKGDQVVSQITDNGYGIPKAQQDRVFQKFFRAENVAKVETDGTGLGLYLVKAIIESSGGKVWFESEEGKGTTFWFSLPITGMKAKAGEVTLDV